MPSSLNLTLPEGPRPRPRLHWLQALTFAVAAATLVLVAFSSRKTATAPGAKGPDGEGKRLEKLAADLERRTLYAQAADVWGEYLAAADLTAEERAEILYRRGKCLKEGGRYAEAARFLSEVEALNLPRETKRRVHQLLLDCFTALGKRDAYDAASRAFAMGAPEQATVLARVRDEPITKEFLRERIEGEARSVLTRQGAPLTPAELAEQAAAIASEQLKDPQAEMAALQQALSMRLLYLEGLERGFGDDQRTVEEVSRLRESYIANRVLESELEKALQNLGPTEVSNHYEAHKERFVEKAGSQFSYARLEKEEEAKAALEKLRSGAGAEVALKTASGFAVEGEPVPEIGQAAEIAAHLLALGEGEVSDRPIEHAGGFYVFRVEKKRPQRQLELKEAEARVKADLAQLKREEALKALQEVLPKKFPVEIMRPGEKAPQEGGTPEEKGAPAGGAPGAVDSPGGKAGPADKGAPTPGGGASGAGAPAASAQGSGKAPDSTKDPSSKNP